MTIADAQVEAAAKAIYENAPVFKAPETPRPTWEETPHRYRKSWLRMARRGLEAAERVAWRPIEEAPRTPSNQSLAYLGLWCSSGFRVGFIHQYEDRPGIYFWSDDGIALEPTHWRPLPAGPGDEE